MKDVPRIHITDPRPLGHLGAFLLGGGLATRLLVPPGPVSGPVVDAVPAVMLFAGAGLVILERAMRGGGTFPARFLLLPLLLLPGMLGASDLSLTRGLEFAAAVATGLAIRDLVLRDGLRGAVLRLTTALSVLVALLALAQSLYQRAEVRAAAETTMDPIAETAMGRAFLASGRAAATFLNPNILGGFLLLMMPLATIARRPGKTWLRGPAPWLTGILAGGFAAAASGGATLALAFGAGTLLLLRPGVPEIARRVAVACLAAGIVALAGIAACLALGWSPAFLGSKVTTFGERGFYHLFGFRLLPEIGSGGLGFEMTREMIAAVQRPGEPWSAYLHDSWFQLVLEGGPLILLAGVPLVATVRGLLRGRAAPHAAPARTLAIALHAGAVGGAILVSSRGLVRGVTIWPLSWEKPWLDALTATGILLSVLWWLRNSVSEEAFVRPALAVALGSFLLHGFLDFDLQVPAVAMAFAVVLAVVPGRSLVPSRQWALALAGVVLLAMPLLAGLHALGRDELERTLADLRRSGEPSEMALQTLRLHATSDLDALETLAAIEKVGDPPAPVTDRLPERLRRTPRARRIEARWLARTALRHPQVAAQSAEQIAGLIRTGEQATSEILYRLALVHLVQNAGDRARAAANASLDAALAFGMDASEAHWLPELLELTGR